MSNQRITAILAADVAGYTRLMEADEARTLKALNALREVVGRHVSLHSGRIANTAGDSVLAEFPSAVAAVSCALTLQETLSVENPEHAGLQLRIGVHLGDVVEQAGDLFGTAVNVAARLQSIGEPGTVTVSGVVFDSVRGKLPAAEKDLGPKSLKNIDQPMRVFQLSPTIGASGRVLAAWDKRAAAHGGEERVSIAVLPFLSISGDADMGFIADGLTEDIITELSRQREFLVIARNTVFTYKGRAVDVMQVGRDLSVRYVLEGSLRRLGPRVRLTAQLIACDTGSHLWAEKFDRAEADLMDVQDEIVRAVAASTHTQLVIAEGTASERETVGSTAWKLHKQAWKEILRLTETSLRKAEQIGNDLIAMNPNDANGYQIVAFARSQLRELGARPADDVTLREDLAIAERALNLNPEDERSNFVYSNALYQAGRHNEAISFGSRALELNPSFLLAYGVRAVAHVTAGHTEEAIRDSETGIRLNPRDPTNFYRYIVMAEAHYVAGNYDLARHWAAQCATAKPEYWLPYVYLSATAQQAGDEKAARANLARLQATLPGATIAKVRTYLYGGAIEATPLLTSLREAGLPG